MTTVALIPARGGSKGIARKNMALLAGRPLIDYTLDAAVSATGIDRLFVSTDDEALAAHCETRGIAVPYRRPADLATDTAGMVDVALDMLEWLAGKESLTPDRVVLLQPTSPFRTAADIDGTLAAMDAAGAQSAVSVHAMAEHPFECIRVGADGWSMLATPPADVVRRQDYGETFYFINGAVYAVSPLFLRTHSAFVAPGRATALYMMPAERGIDIDEPADLRLAEALMHDR